MYDVVKRGARRTPPRQRFRVVPGALDKEPIPITPREARHMLVLRLRPGDTVHLFDGAGSEVKARLARLSRAGGAAVDARRVSGEQEPVSDARLSVALLQAVPRRARRFDTVVRLATELGVARIAPLLTSRGSSMDEESSSEQRLERWRRIAETSAKQCGRLMVPDVLEPVEWANLPWERLPRPRLLLHPDSGSSPLREVLEGEAPLAATLIVGPEGGWSPEDLERAQERQTQRVSLGPHILRADSVGVVALSILQHCWGDLG